MCHPKGRSAAKDARSALTRRPALRYLRRTCPRHRATRTCPNQVRHDTVSSEVIWRCRHPASTRRSRRNLPTLVAGEPDSLCRAEISVVEDALHKSTANWVSVAELLKEPTRNGISPAIVDSNRSDLRTVSIGAVSRGTFEPAKCTKQVAIDRSTASPFLVRRGDAFVVRGNGNRSLCGLIGLSERSYDDLFYPDLLIRLRFDEALILPRFAVVQWNTPSVHRQLSARAKSTNGIWKVNGQDVQSHQLAVPPLADQHALVRTVRRLRDGVSYVRERRGVVLKLMLVALNADLSTDWRKARPATTRQHGSQSRTENA